MCSLITTLSRRRPRRDVRANGFLLAWTFSLMLPLVAATGAHCRAQGCEDGCRRLARGDMSSLNLGSAFGEIIGVNQTRSQSRRYAAGIAHARLEAGQATPRGGDTQTFQKQEELRAKLERQQEALARHWKAGEIVPHVNALMDVAETYEALNELENASDYYARTLPLLRPVTDDSFKAAVLLKLGQLSHRLERYQQAIDYFEQALPLSPKVQDAIFEATVHVQLGLTYKFLGNRQQAFEQFNRALSVYEKVKDPEKVAHAYALLGLTAQTRKEALDYYTRSLTANQKLGSKTGEALALEALATFYSDFDQRTALGYYEQALAIWLNFGRPTYQAPIFMQMGLLYDQLGEMSKARESFQKSIAIWQSLGDRAHEAEVTIYLGVATDEESDALRHFNHAAGLWRAENKPEWEASSLAFVSLIQAHLGLRREALDTLSRIALLKERTGARAPGNGHLDFYVGLTYRVLNDHQQALKHLQLAVNAARAMEEHMWELQALGLSGRSCEAEGEPRKALAYYLEAIAVREKIIEGTGVDEIKILLAEQSADAYERAVLLAFELGDHVQAFELSERARARALLDQLGNDRINLRRGVSTELIEQEQALRLEVAALERQLGSGRVLPVTQQPSAGATRALAGRLAVRRQEYVNLLARLKASNPEYAALRTIDPISLKSLQALLDPGTTLVSYFVTPKQSLAFIITRDSFRAVELCAAGRCVSGQELKDAVTQFRGFAELSDPHPPSLRKLYVWLIEPIKQYLRTAMVCVIPHGVLHYLPFAALSSGGSFLGEHYGIYYLPSASVLPFIRRKPAAADSLLAVAQSNVEGLPLLKHADETAQKIAARYNTQALTGSAATETAFRARAPGTRNLFLAAHGKMNPSSPLFSSIFLAPDEKNDGLLQVHEVYELDLREADHVMLSGCQTQLGDLSRGDEVVGLNRAFLYAGTPTVIASLWSVREQQTGELMVSFYEGRSRGLSKAAALQEAQALVRASHPHPYYWAAFVLTGAP
jgi:CHAT domain-containing protein